VDDHADTLAAMTLLLESLGCVVTAASCVREALAVARDGAYDLLVSDIGLPDGSGIDIMRELSQRTSLRGIALSGFGTEDDLRRSIEAGFDEHLVKPVNLNHLETLVRQYASPAASRNG
jgi:CheY-like chemotaxis protein